MRPDIVFLGDSITRFWPGNDRRLFRFGRVDAGVNGDTTAGMLTRFERDVVALEPRAVHIMGGTNDLWHGVPGADAALTIANIAAITKLARDHGIAVILASPPPISPAAEALFGHPGLFPPLRAAIAAHCRRQGLVHVEYAKSLCDAAGMLVPAFTTDGVHLTRKGYRAMREQAEEAIRGALPGDRWRAA